MSSSSTLRVFLFYVSSFVFMYLYFFLSISYSISHSVEICALCLSLDWSVNWILPFYWFPEDKLGEFCLFTDFEEINWDNICPPVHVASWSNDLKLVLRGVVWRVLFKNCVEQMVPECSHDQKAGSEEERTVSGHCKGKISLFCTWKQFCVEEGRDHSLRPQCQSYEGLASPVAGAWICCFQCCSRSCTVQLPFWKALVRYVPKNRPPRYSLAELLHCCLYKLGVLADSTVTPGKGRVWTDSHT